jgi:hypothetical protein
MKNILKYVVGFRTDTKWKKVIAIIYYLLCLFTLFGRVGVFLIMLSMPFILFGIIGVIKRKDKISIATLVIAIIVCGVGGNLDNSTPKTASVSKEIVTSEKVTEVKTKTPEQIKKEVDDKIKLDAEAKIIADAQAIKDKETARLKAIEDKKVAVAKVEADKVAYDTGITYDQLARTPDKYKTQKVKFNGTVIQVTEEGESTSLRVAVNDDYDTILLVIFENSIISSRLLENDNITIKGVSEGVYTYETVMGNKMTLPLVRADSIKM